MKKEEQLYQLIKELSPAEKKYVRLNISKFRKEEQNKKLLLFDSLNQQKKYKENVTESAYQQAGHTSDFLAADRYDLYNWILESLTDFHRKTTAEVQVSDGYQKVVLLFEKKLFQQALKQANRVEKLAKQAEAFGLLIALYHLKGRILKVLNRLDEASLLFDQQQEIWNQQQEVNQYQQLHYDSIKLRIKLAKVRSSERLQELDAFISNPLLQTTTLPQSFQAKFHYWETYCNYYFIKDNKQAELKANQLLASLYESYPHFKKNEPLNYLIFHTRILAISRSLYPSQFLENLALYRQLNKGFTKQKQQAESIIFIFSYNYELDYHIHHQNWEQGLEIIPFVLKNLKKYDIFIQDALKITAYYRIAYLYFFTGHYNKTLDALKKVLEDYPATLRPDVYSFALLMNIITHYELKNWRLLPYLIKTAAYHINTRNMMFQTEKVALQFLKKIAKKTNEDKHPVIFKAFSAAIQELVDNSEYERRSLQFFDFITWINSYKG